MKGSKLPVGLMSVGQLSVSQISVAECLSAKCLLTKCLLTKCILAKCLSTKDRVGHMLIGFKFFDQKTPNHFVLHLAMALRNYFRP